MDYRRVHRIRSAERAEQIGERADACERERKIEPAILRHAKVERGSLEVEHLIFNAKAAALGLSNEEAIKRLLGEKEPSMQFTTPEELGELAVFFCSAAGNNVRGVAWNMDGGWAAQ